jgi:predicted ester cyclase
MSTEKNKAVVRRYAEEVWNKGNLDLIDELMDANYVNRGPGLPEVRGAESFKEFVSDTRTAFSDIRFTIEDQIAEGYKVVTRYKAIATHSQEWIGVPATGKQVTWTEIVIDLVVDGRLMESYFQMDVLGLLQQLGVVPPLGEE